MKLAGRGLAAFGICLSLAATVALAADDKTQNVKAGDLTFKAPGAWKSEKPKSVMRAATLKAGPAEGDKEPAELVVFVFPGGAGGVDANVSRWETQFRNAEGRAPKAKVTKAKGSNVDVTKVELDGRFVAPVTPGSSETLDKPGFKLLGAIVVTPEAGYFLKMIGPEKTMAEASKGFDELIASMTIAKD